MAFGLACMAVSGVLLAPWLLLFIAPRLVRPSGALWVMVATILLAFVCFVASSLLLGRNPRRWGRVLAVSSLSWLILEIAFVGRWPSPWTFGYGFLAGMGLLMAVNA